MSLKVGLNGTGVLALALVGGVVYLYVKRAAIVEAINPLNKNNAPYRAVTELVQTPENPNRQITDFFQHSDGTFKWPWQANRTVDQSIEQGLITISPIELSGGQRLPL